MKRILWILNLFIICAANSYACTNFLVTKGASAKGATMISYAADSHTLYGELYFWPAAKYAAGKMLKIYEWDTGKYLGEIPQAAETYTVNGNMNEHALAIGETTYGGREELVDSTGIIDYGSLIYITLQRAKNAREAIKIMAELVAQHGYCSSGESFSICDPDEVWILEMIGKGIKADPKTGANLNKGAVWVAVKIPDGYISAHANQARIQNFTWSDGKTSISSKEMNKIFLPEVETVYSHDVAEIARQYGFYSGDNKSFSFSDAYNPVDFSGARACEARVWAFFRSVNNEMSKYEDYAMGRNLKNRMPLYVKPFKQLTLKHTIAMMRDHYEGTPMDMSKDIGAGPYRLPYRWRPMSWEVDGKKYVHERAIATQQTGFWFVAECRSHLPRPLAGILWFGVDDAATSCLTPIYSCSHHVPCEFAAGNGSMLNYSDESAFWIFNRVANFAYLRYDAISADIQKVQQEIENHHEQEVKAADEYALWLYEQDPAKARDFLTELTVHTASTMFKRWKELDHYLLVKYIDGNIKKEKDTESGKIFERNPYGISKSPNQPHLPEFWRRIIVNDAGETLKAN
ncbi:MAG: C69 family dipeptidase [Prevotellaceae bacterium]|jgi:dipeptidase|nr:C69 family dipeptidase [Prevotellaceae bacterium]